MATAETPPFEDAIYKSRLIIEANWRHFLALSFLFLLPFSFFTAVFPEIFPLIIHQFDPKTVILLLLAYVVVATVFHLLAVGSIAYSIHQGFNGKSPKLISSLKSSFASFFPLLATVISSNLIVLLILLMLGFPALLLNRLIKSILPDFEIDYTDPLNWLPVVIIPYVIVMNLYRNWILAWVIVVVESTWGLTPLKRSRNLIKGLRNKSFSRELRRDSLSIILIFFTTHAKFGSIIRFAADGQIYNEGEETGKLWIFTFVALPCLMLLTISLMTVSYIQCKADHGEPACDIGGEYVSLPSDDGKVASLVSLPDNNA